MTDLIEFTITESDPDFFQALQEPEKMMPLLADAMNIIVEAYKEVAWNYAPESEANAPGRVDGRGDPMGYYERGRGWWYPVVTHNTMGMFGELPVVGPHPKGPKTMGAMALLARGLGVAGYKLEETSQQMHDRWVTEVQQNVDGVIGYLRNTATYSSLVQGQDQTTLHASRDWQTVMDSWNDPDVQEAVSKATNEALNKFFNLQG